MNAEEQQEAMRQKSMSGAAQEQVQKLQEQRQQQMQQEEQIHGMLATLLTNEARERLARIRLVKESKARAVEIMLIKAAQAGKLGGKVTDEYLVRMLEQINAQQGDGQGDRRNTSGPKIIRMGNRKPAWESDDDDY